MAGETNVTRREKAAATRLLLFRAATALFAEHGYHDTSVEAIVRRAGVAKGTFFVHFRSKNAVIDELVAQQVAFAYAEMERARADNRAPLEVLRRTVLALAKHAAKSRSLSRVVVASSLADANVGDATNGRLEGLFAELLKVMRDAKKQARHGEEPNPKAAIVGAMTAYYGQVLYWCTTLRAPPLEKLVERALDSLLGSKG